MILPILSALSGIGGFLGNQPQKSSATNQSSSASSSNSTTTPDYDPLNLSLRDTLLDKYRQSLDQDPDLSGYKAQGIAQIQSADDARTNAIKNSLASRGLSYSPIAAIAPSLSHGQEVGDISSFINSVPLLADSLRQQKPRSCWKFRERSSVWSEYCDKRYTKYALFWLAYWTWKSSWWRCNFGCYNCGWFVWKIVRK